MIRTWPRRSGRTVTITEGHADDRDQHREQVVYVGSDGSVQLPSDVQQKLPPGSRLRVIRKPNVGGVHADR